jgi:spermidine synthase
MSATTPSSEKTPAQEEAVSSVAGHTFQRWLLVLLVFVGGATSLGIELSASRLLAPYFGTSLFVWANLIGLILLYLTVGYYLGGHLADRYPSPTWLYGMTAVAALLTSLIPLLSRPILNWSLTAFATFSVSVFISSLVSVILLFAVPMILLGCVSPFAIRLSVDRIGRSGRTAGLLYAISTGGSIVGTFLPVLILIPTIGTYKTFLLFAGTLLLVSIIGLIATREASANKNNRNKRVAKRWFSLLLLIPTLATALGIQGPIKPASGTNGGDLITERESAYNYIQVVQSGKETQLVLNEGLGIHSIYNPDQILTQGPWDDFMAAPLFNNVPFTQGQVKRVCVIGLGAGTLARELTAVYGPIPIDGVEIDSEIVSVGRKYFNMNEPNLNVIVQDGRYFLRSTEQKYDIIGIDAYQQPYIPFQLTTTEFFKEIKEHLTPTGVAVINVGRTTTDFRLVNALAQNIHTVYPNVYIVDNQRFNNSLVFATNNKTQLSNFAQNAGQLTNPLLQQVAQADLSGGNIREEQRAKVFFTDDIAPVEQLIDLIIFNAAQTGKA